ncbi:MAG TPA: type II toxin-antitoxin system prevent-host-death family antitoxin [Thermomicrobiaceae bacterium]|nr:type II toxin-antitoxin system prevent-host-death family antitoxin [Thermomicrobiaceae bacterium]
MEIKVNMHQAKSQLSRLVVRALAGEDVIITRDGQPVARLVPIRQARVPGLAKGIIELAPDFDAPLPDDVLDTFERAG